MARFYASIQGNRGEATRMGSPQSGIFGHIRGWYQGGKVRCYINDEGEDVTEIWVTGGSKGKKQSILVAQIINGKLHVVNQGTTESVYANFRVVEWW